MPPADVVTRDDGVTVFMDVPGISGDQLEIELDNDMLAVRGERPYPYATGTALPRSGSSNAASAASSAACGCRGASIPMPSRHRSRTAS